jgi:hypothetical protein
MRKIQIVSFLLLALIATGCHTYTFNPEPYQLAEPQEKRDGIIALKVVDSREDKSKIGIVRGGFGNKLGDISTTGDLETILASAFKETLEKAGFTVMSNAPVTLEVQINEFWIYGGGMTRSAQESVRLRLRDKDKILWEQGLKEHDNGMLNGPSSYKKSMNTAFTRLLADSLEEFTSDFFYQNVTNNSGKR